MPYAKTDQIGTDPIEDGVEITDAQYQEAIDAMLSGRKIVVENGALRFEELAPSTSLTQEEIDAHVYGKD